MLCPGTFCCIASRIPADTASASGILLHGHDAFTDALLDVSIYIHFGKKRTCIHATREICMGMKPTVLIHFGKSTCKLACHMILLPRDLSFSVSDDKKVPGMSHARLQQHLGNGCGHNLQLEEWN